MSSVVSFVCFAILRHTISHYLLTFHCDTEGDKVPNSGQVVRKKCLISVMAKSRAMAYFATKSEVSSKY